jgi:hypothetical protein
LILLTPTATDQIRLNSAKVTRKEYLSLIEKSAPLISIAPTLFGGQVGFNYLQQRLCNSIGGHFTEP